MFGCILSQSSLFKAFFRYGLVDNVHLVKGVDVLIEPTPLVKIHFFHSLDPIKPFSRLNGPIGLKRILVVS